MGKNCRIKFKVVNAFKASRAYKSVLSQIDINEDGISASSYEELSSKIIQLFSKALSEQQAFFSIFGTDEFISVSNKEFKGEFFDKNQMQEKVAKAELELASKLEALFKAAEESNSGIELVLSRFMTEEILSTILNKLDHYERNKSKYRGAVASTIEGYLVKTLDWLSLIVNDEKKKGNKKSVETINNVNQAISKINKYLGNQIKFAFPQYVQIPFGYMTKAKYIDNFYLDSETNEDSAILISNPIDREITSSIIELQKTNLKNGSIPDFGLARAYSINDKILYKLFRVTYDKDFIYTEIDNQFTGEKYFSEEKGELFKPDNRKLSPFNINGQSDFTNFISNFDNITPKRVGDKTIPEHNPTLLKVNVSKNVSVTNNAEIQLAIQNTIDSIVKKSQVFSNIPAFIAGREHYLEGNTPVYNYYYDGNEIKIKETPFTGLVTKGLNSNIDIILYQEGEHKTFIGDYDPLNYVKVTNSGAVKVDISELEDPSFIERYFSLAPNIKINDNDLESQIIQDLINLNDWNESSAIDFLSVIKSNHKGVIPLQFIATLKSALESKGGNPGTSIFYDKTIQSFQDKVTIVRNAENLLEDNTVSKNVNLDEIGVSGHTLQLFPNTNSVTKSYSNNFNLGGEFQGYQIISTVKRGNTNKPILVLYLYKDGKPDFSTEANQVKTNFLKLLSKDQLESLVTGKWSKQITYLHYSGESSNIITPLFLSVKPLEGNIEDSFIFNSKFVFNNTKENISIPFDKKSDFYIGSIDNKTLLKKVSPNLDNPQDLPFNILGLKLDQKEIDTLINISSDILDKNVLINGLTKYFFDNIKNILVQDDKNKRKQILPQDVIDLLNKTFLGSDTFQANFLNEKYIRQKMSELADVIKSLQDKKLYNSVQEKDFVLGTLFDKLHHNLDEKNPVRRVLRFNVSNTPFIDVTTSNKPIDSEPDIVTAQEFTGDTIDDESFLDSFGSLDNLEYDWEQRVGEVEYIGDRSLDSIETRQEFLQKIAGDNRIIDVDNLKNKIDNLLWNNQSLGAVLDAIVYLDKESSTQGVFYHEAGHRVFNYLLTREEQDLYINESKKLGYTEEQINKFLANRNLPNTQANIDLFYVEQIMNLFAQYKLNKDNASYISLVGYWFKNLFDTILDFLHISRNQSLSKLFRDIDKGKYRERIPGKVEPFYQNIKTTKYPLNSEDTENLFYNLYGALINIDKYKPYLDKYKATKNLDYLKEYYFLQKDKVLKILNTFPNVTDERLLNTLKIEDDLEYNLGLFSEFLEDKIFELDFIPEKEPMDFVDEFGEEELGEDLDTLPKETNISDAKYNNEVFVEPKVKSFINSIVGEERIIIGKINDILQVAPIYTKVNDVLINKAQKDFSLVPIGTNQINHFMTYLEGFARYDIDYQKLLKNINNYFQITKEEDGFKVGKNKFFLEGLIKNFTQNRLYYSQVYTKRGGSSDTAFDTMEEEELILSNNNGNVLNVFASIGRPPKFEKMNIIKFYSSKDESVSTYVKFNKKWFSVVGNALIDIKDFDLEKAFNDKYSNITNLGIAKLLRQNVKRIENNLESYSKTNNISNLDNAVREIQFSFSLINIPITGSYAYMVALNSIKKPFIYGNLDILGALEQIAIILERTNLQEGFLKKQIRNSPHTKQLIIDLSSVQEELFNAMVNGSNLSFNSVKGADGKSYYAFSYNNLTSKLDTNNDTRFLTNDIIREPVSRISNMFNNLGIKKSFDKLTEDELFVFIISQYKKGFYNLDQLEANSTNFSVKGGKDIYGHIMNKTLTLTKEEALKERLSEGYRDVAEAMYRRLKIYDEIQPLLLETKNESELELLLNDLNQKYDLLPGVDALELKDLDNKLISDRAFNKPGFNTFFNILPVRYLKTRKEVENYIQEVNTNTFKTSVLDAVIGSIRTNISKPQGLVGQIWDNGVVNNPLLFNNIKNKDATFIDLHKSFILNMTLNYIIETHQIYKRILGKEYFHGFKSVSNGDFNKRLKLIGIFGQNIDEGNFIEIPDIKEKVILPEATEWKKDNAYTSEYTEDSKDVLESTDGNAIATFERIIQIQKAKTRLDEKVLSYYIAQITNNRFVFENTVQKATPKDILEVEKYAEESNALNGLFKTALGDQVNERIRYYKMAYFAVPRNMYMKPKETVSEESLDAAYLKVALATISWLDNYENYQDKIEAYKELYSLHEPVLGQEKLFDNYQNLETNNIQVAVYKSTSKAYKSNNITKVHYGAEKHQTENTNKKKKITLSTQAEANLIHDQNPETLVWNGKDVIPVKQLINECIQTRKNLNDIKGALLLGTLFKDGKVDIPLLSYYLKQYVSVTKSKDYLTGLFDIFSENGELKFHTDINSPESIYILIQVITKISNEINTLKVPGDAYGLIPASHYSVVEDELGYVPLTDRKKGQARPLQPRQLLYKDGWHLIPFTNKEKFIADTLNGKKDSIDTAPIMEVHEVVIPAHDPWQKEYLIDRDKMRKGEITLEELNTKYPKELFLIYYTRIPHEEKRSGAVGYIVDFLPSNVGSVGIIPTIKMREDGHDFDNDKMYTSKPVIVKEDNVWKIKNSSESTMYDKIENHPFLKQRIKSELKSNIEYNQILKEINTLKNVISETKEEIKPFFKTVSDMIPLIEDKEATNQQKREFIIDQLLNDSLVTTNELGEQYTHLVNSETKEIYKDYQSLVSSLKFKESQKKAIQQKTLSGYVNNVRTFASKYGFDHVLNLDEEVETNNLLMQYISLHSNRHTLETGLIREQTNYDFATNWTKNELKKRKELGIYNIIGSPLRVSRNISKAVEGGQGISIAAKFMKTLIDLKEMGASINGIKILNNDFNSIQSQDKYVKIGKEFVNKLNEAITKYNENQKEPLDLIDPSIEDYKLNNLKTSIYVSIMTDSIKNQFGLGLNLNNLTYPIYVIGTALGIPQTALLTVASSDYIREINTQAKLDKEIERLTDSLERDNKGALPKVGALTDDDLINLYFYSDFAYDSLDSSFVLDENNNEKKVNGYKVLSDLGVLQLKTLKFVNKINQFSKGLFSIGTVTNSNKNQLFDAKLKTISLLTNPWDSKDKSSPTIYNHLGLEKPEIYNKQSISFDYRKGIPESRVNNVKWDSIIFSFFNDYINLNKNNIATNINSQLGIENINTLWFKDMASILFNANTEYDVKQLPKLKKKIENLNIKYDYKISLLSKLNWEAGIFYLPKGDKYEKDIVNYQAEIKDMDIDDYPIMAELLQATRYIWGWQDTLFSPINYFPSEITNLVTQDVSEDINKYTHDLEKLLLKRSDGIAAKPFNNGLAIPTKKGADHSNKGIKYLQNDFKSDYTKFKLTNVPIGVIELNKYQSKGRNIYKKVFSEIKEIKKNVFLEDAIYTLIKNYKDNDFELEAFNPFAHTRLSDMDTFKIRAEEISMDSKDMLDGVIFNNIFVAYRTKNGKRLTKDNINKKYMNRIINVDLENQSLPSYQIGFVNQLKESYAGIFQNTVFDVISHEMDSIFTFRVTTDLPQNRLIELYNGDMVIREITDNKKLENTFLKLKDFTSELSNLDILELTNDIVDEYGNDERDEFDVEAKVRELEKEGLLEIDCKGKLKAEKGLQTNFTKGGKWELYEIFEGKSHKQGGIDINIKNNQISFTNKNGSIKAKYGLVISKDN